MDERSIIHYCIDVFDSYNTFISMYAPSIVAYCVAARVYIDCLAQDALIDRLDSRCEPSFEPVSEILEQANVRSSDLSKGVKLKRESNLKLRSEIQSRSKRDSN